MGSVVFMTIVLKPMIIFHQFYYTGVKFDKTFIRSIRNIYLRQIKFIAKYPKNKFVRKKTMFVVF